MIYLLHSDSTYYIHLFIYQLYEQVLLSKKMIAKLRAEMWINSIIDFFFFFFLTSTTGKLSLILYNGTDFLEGLLYLSPTRQGSMANSPTSNKLIAIACIALSFFFFFPPISIRNLLWNRSQPSCFCAICGSCVWHPLHYFCSWTLWCLWQICFPWSGFSHSFLCACRLFSLQTVQLQEGRK